MERLFVLYDARCGLCRWVKNWASDQPAFVDLEFVAAGSARAEWLFPGLSKPGTPDELVAVSDEGHVFRGDSAWIMCFYALEDYREWSERLASPLLRPLARQAFAMLSKNRVRFSDWLGLSDREAHELLGSVEAPACEVAASSLQRIHEMVAGPDVRDGTRGDERPSTL